MKRKMFLSVMGLYKIVASRTLEKEDFDQALFFMGGREELSRMNWVRAYSRERYIEEVGDSDKAFEFWLDMMFILENARRDDRFMYGVDEEFGFSNRKLSLVGQLLVDNGFCSVSYSEIEWRDLPAEEKKRVIEKANAGLEVVI